MKNRLELASLTEIFDTSRIVVWSRVSPSYRVGAFKFSGSSYEICIYSTTVTGKVVWEVAFQTEEGELGILNNKEAFKIFGTVINAIIDQYNKVLIKPELIWFSADDTEPSRQKLYSAMTRKLAKIFKLKYSQSSAGKLTTYSLYKGVNVYESSNKRKDILPGGKGDKLNFKDVNQKELAKGIKVELEHTSNKALAKEIALDHLAEDPHYYSKLSKIHKEEYKLDWSNLLLQKLEEKNYKPYKEK